MHPEPKPDMPMEEREGGKRGKEERRKGGDVRISTTSLTFLSQLSFPPPSPLILDKEERSTLSDIPVPSPRSLPLDWLVDDRLTD